MTDVLEAFATSYHAPILVREILDYIDPTPGKLIVDATLGGGGHSCAMLDAGASVIGFDRDPDAIETASARLAEFGDAFTPILSNYSRIREQLDARGIGRVDAMLLDAGVSSHQLDEGSRGFSIRFDGPLDMRMGPDTLSLADYLDEVEPAQLRKVLREYGEVKSAHRLANLIVEARRAGKLESTSDLKDLINNNTRSQRKTGAGVATLVFQALRIEVNDELTHLRRAVEASVEVVKPGGVIAFIAFHSLEDRIVKHVLRALVNRCVCPPGLPVCACGRGPLVELLHRKPIRPKDDEVEFNFRARSAVLRVARVIE